MAEFIEWLKQQGCDVVCTQEDDGSGYAIFDVSFDVTPANSMTVTVTVDA